MKRLKKGKKTAPNMTCCSSDNYSPVYLAPEEQE
jgi:hypothetical protein